MLLREDEEGRSPLRGGTEEYLRTECTLGSSLEAEEPTELGSRSWQKRQQCAHRMKTPELHTQDQTLTLSKQCDLSGLFSYDGRQTTAVLSSVVTRAQVWDS